MNFWKQFFELLLHHPSRIFISFFWLIQGKRKRARNRLGLLETHSLGRFRSWQNCYEKNILNHIMKKEILEDISFLVCISSYPSPYDSTNTVSSLKKQSYNNWILYKETDGFINGNLSQFDFLIWIREGDILPAYALKKLASTIQENPKLDIFYSDHDYIAPNGRREFPYFKGAWNYALLLSSDYVFGLCAIRTQLLSPIVTQFNIFSWTGRYQSLVALGLKEELRTLHISAILYHCNKSSDGHPEIELLQAHEIGQKLFHKPSPIKTTTPSTKTNLNLITLPAQLSAPKITIILPTRDGLNLLEPCIESILTRTTYQNYNILVVDNNSQQTETLDYLNSISSNKRITILRYTEKFNYAAINNYAAKQANGEYICTLNNDTEIIEPRWLEYLISWAIRPDVGAVGAKLLYADNRIQHAGVIIGLGGLAGHGHRYLKNSEPGYFYRAHLPQYASAVTAACLLVEKKKYLEVGGMDSENFTVAFNDVDFCLKLDAAGYNNVYEPRAVLYHHESQSRGKDMRGEKRKRYLRECEMLQKRWSTDRVVDHYYSPHLAPDREDFAIRTTAVPARDPN